MANMSYCMFENTNSDLRDCVGAMEEAMDLEDLDLNKTELSSLKNMRWLCERFLEEADRLLDAEGGERDGQPDEAQEWADFDPDC
jgi:hypothetical protein